MNYITQMRQIIECILIKNYNADYENVYIALQKHFCNESQKVLNFLKEIVQNGMYSQDYFYNKVLELTNEKYFDAFINAEEIANIYPFFKEYEKYIQLSLQEKLAKFIMAKVQQGHTINLNYSFLQDYQYKNTAEHFTTFEDAKKQEEQRKYELFPTYVEFLDTSFNGGLTTGQLILISGNYESGKTTLSTQILENITSYQPVCFFCFEFTISAYIQRRKKFINPMFKEKNMILIADGYDIQDIKANIEYLHQTKNIKVFLIDSQMRIENNHSKSGNGEEKESEKFEILGKLAHKEDIIIFLIIQTSKADPDTPFKSKKGAHEANIIIHLENKEDDKVSQFTTLQKRILKVKKNKQTGKHFKEEIYLNTKTSLFEKNNKSKFKDKENNHLVQPLYTISLQDIPEI